MKRYPLGTCKEKTMKQIDKIDNTDSFMSPFCGFQSKSDKEVSKHNSQYHYNKINFSIIGNTIWYK